MLSVQDEAGAHQHQKDIEKRDLQVIEIILLLARMVKALVLV